MKTSVCKDLGTMFPECMLVKFTNVASWVVRDTLTTAQYYNGYLLMYPYQGLAQMTRTSGSVLTNDPMGWTKMVGDAAPGLYKRCCVVSARYSVIIHPLLTSQITSAAGTGTTIQDITHFKHSFSSSTTFEPAPVSLAALDLSLAQPDVYHKKTRTPSVIHYDYDAGGPVMASINLPAVSWHGTYWPHKELSQPYTDYVGDATNYGTVSTAPSKVTYLQFAGAHGDPAAASTAQSLMSFAFTIRVTYNCILKDRNVAITR
jgi:hypothetical protein